MNAFQPGDRVRVRRRPAAKGTVQAGSTAGRVIASMDCAGVRTAFVAADLEPDLPPAFEPMLMSEPGPPVPPAPSYPGPYAVPGVMQPGFAWPAEPATDWAPGLPWLYTEGYTLIYLQYRDTGAQQTLVAVPGGSYYMQSAGDPGLPADPPGDHRWIRSAG